MLSVRRRAGSARSASRLETTPALNDPRGEGADSGEGDPSTDRTKLSTFL